jgi:prepilin-type N-terminal cleavage/methylation domain-containing protein
MTRGYSLLELIVALAIMSLIVVIATPAVQASVERMTLRADTRTLMTELRRLREEALDRQTDITVTVTGSAPSALQASTGSTIALTPGTSIRSQGVTVAWDGTIRGTITLARGAAETSVVADPLTGRPAQRGAP